MTLENNAIIEQQDGSVTRMTLRVGTIPHSQWQVLIPLLAGLGWREDESTDPESWYHADQGNLTPQDKYLFLHIRPELAVAYAIDAGLTPADAVDEWRTAVEQLLTAYKRNRDHSVVVEVSSGLQEPGTCVAVLKQHLGLTVDSELPELQFPEKPSAINKLLAGQLLTQSDELTGLLAELEACTLPLSDSSFASPSVRITELYEELRKTKPEPTHEQLEEHSRLQATQQLLEKELEQKRREHARIKQMMEEAREENELVLNRLLQVQEELERYNNAGKSTERALNEAQKALKEKDAALSAAKQRCLELAAQKEAEQEKNEDYARLTQTCERITQKLDKALAERDTSEKALAETRQENELILNQLVRVQEELESYYLDGKNKDRDLVAKDTTISVANKKITELSKENKTLAGERENLKKKVSSLNKNVSTLTKKVGDLTAANANLNAEAASSKAHAKALQVNLAQLQTTASWRATAPFRHLATPLPGFKKRRFGQALDLIKQSGLFDAQWYLAQYPDVASDKMSPEEHYLRFGAEELRNPSEGFSTKWYLQTYPDVAEAGINPLVHYLLFGKKEGRSARPG